MERREDVWKEPACATVWTKEDILEKAMSELSFHMLAEMGQTGWAQQEWLKGQAGERGHSRERGQNENEDQEDDGKP